MEPGRLLVSLRDPHGSEADRQRTSAVLRAGLGQPHPPELKEVLVLTALTLHQQERVHQKYEFPAG